MISLLAKSRQDRSGSASWEDVPTFGRFLRLRRVLHVTSAAMKTSQARALMQKLTEHQLWFEYEPYSDGVAFIVVQTGDELARDLLLRYATDEHDPVMVEWGAWQRIVRHLRARARQMNCTKETE
jgi:hypothetical protein